MENKKTRRLVDELAAMPGGEAVRVCMQCGTCTASCPNADVMDHPPAELIAMARAGMRQEVLSSKAPWMCLSCYMCTVRCPRGVKITDLMHAFEGLAERDGLTSRVSRTPVMYRSLKKMVASSGRISEFWLMVRFYLQTNPLSKVGMLPMAAGLFGHGRLSLKSEGLSPEAMKQLRAILDKAESLGGTE